jgi:predicted permease
MKSTGFTVKLRAMKDDLVGNIGETLWILLGTVGFVLLIACANVANLFLVRAEGRQKEVAVRAAMGAGRGRMTRFFLTEAVLLGLLGGVSGLTVAHTVLQLVKSFGPTNLPRLGEVGMTAEVLLFTGTVSLLAGLFFGATPIFRTRRTNLVETLKEGGRSSSGRARHRMRTTLVVAQVALALVLLVGSGLMVRSFLRLRAVEPGFDPSSTLTMRLSLPEAEYPGIEDVASFVRELSERIDSIPGVEVAGTTTVLPLRRGDQWGTRIEDHPVPEGGVPLVHPLRFVSPDYFAAMGIPLISGRTFEWADQEQSRRVAIVSRAFAEKYWPKESPIGKRLSNFDFEDDEWHTIVGVVGDVRASGVDQELQQAIFVPLTGHDEIRRSFSLVIRTTGYPEYLTDTVRNEVWTIDPNLPVSNVQTLEELLSSSTARTSFAMTMLAIAAGVALLLGSIGIYGVISYVVSLRTQEIGIRMALGANRRDVSRMVMRQGMAVVLGGVLIGLLGSVALTRFLQSFLFEVSPLDPLTFAAVSVAMVAVGLVAGFLPARRAAAVDPALSLHEE